MKRTQILLSAVVVLTLIISAFAVDAGNKFHVRKDDSRVSFTLTKWSVFKEEGRFTNFSGQIHYHPKHPSEIEVRFQVDVRSIDTQNRKRNQRLLDTDFFDANRYPMMRFASTSAAGLDDGSFTVTGNLTIKGVTKSITIPIRPLGINRVNGFGTIAGFETQFQINRMDYDVTGHRWSDGKSILGHEVDIHLLVSAELK